MKKLLIKAVLSAAALVCAGAANAYVIDFESVDTSTLFIPPIFLDQEYITQGNANIQALNPNNVDPNTGALLPPDGSLVGQLMSGSDPDACLGGACPIGDSTTFMTTLNDGQVYVDLSGGKITLNSFQAAFLAPAGVALPNTTVSLLGIEADRADGSYFLGYFALKGPNASGLTSFSTFLPSQVTKIGGSGTLTSGNVVDMIFYSYYCGASINCSSDTTNKAQFAIDNITVNVPEPSEWALMALGLAGVGAMARRRRSI